MAHRILGRLGAAGVLGFNVDSLATDLFADVGIRLSSYRKQNIRMDVGADHAVKHGTAPGGGRASKWMNSDPTPWPNM